MKKAKKIILTIIAGAMILFGLVVIDYTLYQSVSSYLSNKRLHENFSVAVEYEKNHGYTENDVKGETYVVSQVFDDPIECEEKPDVMSEEERAKILQDSVYNERQMVANIVIPSVGIDDIAVEGTDLTTISYSLGHFEDTAWPGKVGNFSVCGHRGGKHGKFFKYLPDVKIGDQIFVTDIFGTKYTYEVTENFIIEPDEFWVIDDETDGDKLITLITCANSGTKRNVVKGRLVE